MTDSEFKERYDLWKECLWGNDQNSIRNQLIQLTWDIATFKCINEALGLSPKAPEEGVQQNGLMHDLLARNFFEISIIRVRRLVDGSYLSPGNKGKFMGKDKGVYSLVSLLTDLQTHRSSVTRKRVLDVDGRSLKETGFERGDDLYTTTEYAHGEEALHVSTELLRHKHEGRHRQWDQLANTSADERSALDLIQDQVFDFLLSRLKSITDEIKDYVDKFIAHSATPDSREAISADNIRLTLEHLYKSVRTIVQTFNFISIHLFGGVQFSPLLVVQYDKFAYLDRPLITTDDKHQLEAIWRSFQMESHQWSMYTIDDLFEDMRQP
jgi:hypothetical protein